MSGREVSSVTSFRTSECGCWERPCGVTNQDMAALYSIYRRDDRLGARAADIFISDIHTRHDPRGDGLLSGKRDSHSEGLQMWPR
jgi:hypothetical protein